MRFPFSTPAEPDRTRAADAATHRLSAEDWLAFRAMHGAEVLVTYTDDDGRMAIDICHVAIPSALPLPPIL